MRITIYVPIICSFGSIGSPRFFRILERICNFGLMPIFGPTPFPIHIGLMHLFGV